MSDPAESVSPARVGSGAGPHHALLIAAGGAAVAGLLLLAVAGAIFASWLPFLTGHRVLGQVVTRRGTSFRYVYLYRHQTFSHEVGTPGDGAPRTPPRDTVLELLVDRNDPARSVLLSDLEPLEIMPLAGLGLLFLGYAAAGWMAAWQSGRRRSLDDDPDVQLDRLLSIQRVPQGVLICALVILAILGWCAPMSVRWLTALVALIIQASVLGFSLWRAAQAQMPSSDPKVAATLDPDGELARVPFPRVAAPSRLDRAA